MIICPSCGASVSETRTTCLKCGATYSPESLAAMPKIKTKYKEGTGVLAVILFVGFTAGVAYGFYRAYGWWSHKKAVENSVKMAPGPVKHEKFPLLHSSLKVIGRYSKAYLSGELYNESKRPIDNVVVRYGCKEPLGTGSSMSLGPVRPMERRPIDVWVFDTNVKVDCNTEIDQVYVGPKIIAQ